MLKSIRATFVIPGGCNLRCRFCIIRQRGETQGQKLRPDDYMRFLSDILCHFRVTNVAIQGHEPLLNDESVALSMRILRVAARFGCHTSLVTNGVNLSKYANSIGVGLDVLVVSLHTADRNIYRHIAGADEYNTVIDGLSMLRGQLPGGGILAINSVLRPGCESDLLGMPALMASCGVGRWYLSPLKIIGGDAFKYTPPNLDILRGIAVNASMLGIDMIISDELTTLSHLGLDRVAQVEGLAKDESIFRLSPDGSCSCDRGVLLPVSAVGIWDGKILPHVFLQQIFGGKLIERGHLSKYLCGYLTKGL